MFIKLIDSNDDLQLIRTSDITAMTVMKDRISLHVKSCGPITIDTTNKKALEVDTLINTIMDSLTNVSSIVSLLEETDQKWV